MPNVTKQDLIQDIAQSTGFVRSDIRGVVEQFLDLVGSTLSQGNTIEIRGFGTFTIKERKSRPARNPRTGEVVLLEDRLVPLFKFSAELKDRINRSEFLPQLPETVPHATSEQEML